MSKNMRDVFPGYYNPTDEMFEKMWSEGTFTFDANILLHIYRFTDETRERLFSIFKELEGRIWISYQAANEFQRNRQNVISQQFELYRELQKQLNDITRVIQKHRYHPYREKVEELVNKPIFKLNVDLNEIEKAHPDLLTEDVYREQLTSLLDKCISTPPKESDLKLSLQKAKSRIESGKCPGFKDLIAKKDAPDEQRFGDVLLWFEILNFVEEKKTPIILVTDDKKEDWWQEHKGRTIGPQPSLINEIYEQYSVTFYMYTCDRFLEEAEKYLKLSPSPKSIEEAKNVRKEFIYDDIYKQLKVADTTLRKLTPEKASEACKSTLRTIGLAAIYYADDHGHFPNSENWCEDLKNYLNGLEWPFCPSMMEGVGYAMNSAMSNVSRVDIKNADTTVLFYDANSYDRHASNKDLGNIPFPPRHTDGNNICFADGHVEAIDMNKIQHLTWQPIFE